MYKGKKIIAIIPARSGSKGLKDKNIKLLNNKPLIAYTIESALDSKVFDNVVVSTDSEGYAEIAKKYGANVPFLRSEKNATDTASSWDVVKEVVEGMRDSYDIVILLQPTSPFRSANSIRNAVDMFIERNADTLISVCQTPHSAFWCNVMPADCSAKNFIKKDYRCARQFLPKTYMLNGAIYIVKISSLANIDLFGNNGLLFEMNKEESIDIDTEYDFALAEFLLSRKL